MGNNQNHQELILTFKVLGWMVLWISGGCMVLLGVYEVFSRAVPQP